ncbi:hypothetical protein ACFSHP_26905 [Novosphingobium panipatense]
MREKAGQPATVRMQEGYDHSYYFISTFMAEHGMARRETAGDQHAAVAEGRPTRPSHLLRRR